jgi:uncharacterized repeat protein (TIGR01451 family)
VRQIAVSFALAVVVIALTTASVIAKPIIQLHLSGVRVTTSADGRETTTPVEKVTPKKGQIFRYTIEARNVGNQPALNYVALDKIPNGTEFVGGSASKAPGVKIEFTLDGKTWSAQPIVSVMTSKGLVRRPADPSAFASVRWIAPKVAPKAALTFTYEVRVK